mmetsp:Transcript_26290/g.55849  ORF Transcript_26290/g.55849 Transcript_26290/m.55849 type:complete len:299 (+) Transcript_26290:68-964(+)
MLDLAFPLSQLRLGLSDALYCLLASGERGDKLVMATHQCRVDQHLVLAERGLVDAHDARLRPRLPVWRALEEHRRRAGPTGLIADSAAPQALAQRPVVGRRCTALTRAHAWLQANHGHVHLVHSDDSIGAVQSAQGVLRISPFGATGSTSLQVVLRQGPRVAILVGPPALRHVDTGASKLLEQGGDPEEVAIPVSRLRGALVLPSAEGGAADGDQVVEGALLVDLEGPSGDLGAPTDIEHYRRPVVRTASVELLDPAVGEKLVGIGDVLAKGEACIAVRPVLHHLPAEANIVGPIVLA